MARLTPQRLDQSARDQRKLARLPAIKTKRKRSLKRYVVLAVIDGEGGLYSVDAASKRGASLLVIAKVGGNVSWTWTWSLLETVELFEQLMDSEPFFTEVP